MEELNVLIDDALDVKGCLSRLPFMASESEVNELMDMRVLMGGISHRLDPNETYPTMERHGDFLANVQFTLESGDSLFKRIIDAIKRLWAKIFGKKSSGKTKTGMTTEGMSSVNLLKLAVIDKHNSDISKLIKELDRNSDTADKILGKESSARQTTINMFMFALTPLALTGVTDTNISLKQVIKALETMVTYQNNQAYVGMIEYVDGKDVKDISYMSKEFNGVGSMLESKKFFKVNTKAIILDGVRTKQIISMSTTVVNMFYIDEYTVKHPMEFNTFKYTLAKSYVKDFDTITTEELMNVISLVTKSTMNSHESNGLVTNEIGDMVRSLDGDGDTDAKLKRIKNVTSILLKCQDHIIADKQFIAGKVKGILDNLSKQVTKVSTTNESDKTYEGFLI